MTFPTCIALPPQPDFRWFEGNLGHYAGPVAQVSPQIPPIGPCVELCGQIVPLPPGFTALRPHQVPIIEQAVEHFCAGKRLVLLNAPPGAGKTLVAEMIRRTLGGTMLFLPHTKTLQAQFAGDFDTRLLYGKANYPTLNRPDLLNAPDELRVSCDDCTMSKRVAKETVHGPLPDHPEDTPSNPDVFWDFTEKRWMVHVCEWCLPAAHCPYRSARRAFLAAEVACTNIQYATTSWMGAARNPYSQNQLEFDLVVIDEADTLESVLRTTVEVVISPRMRRLCGIDVPRVLSREAGGALEAWEEWAKQTADTITETVLQLTKTPSGRPRKLDVKGRRQVRALTHLFERVVRLGTEIPSGNWVLDYDTTPRGGDRKYTRDTTPIIFRPIRVEGLAFEAVWAHAPRFLVMSGTLIPETFTMNLGCPEGLTAIIDMPSTFHPLNRPLRLAPVIQMSHRLEQRNKPVIAAVVNEIGNLHPDERILVHTVSYSRARWLMEELINLGTENSERVMTYDGAGDRDGGLARFRASANGIMLAASLDRGISLDDDECRIQCILKVAYPSLGDKLVTARMYDGKDGPLWYSTEALRTFIQSYGRTTRSEDDFSLTYVTDMGFLRLVASYGRFIPEWVKEAFDWGSGGWDKRIITAAQAAINLQRAKGAWDV